MSLEQVIAENTVALRQVAELLAKFGADRSARPAPTVAAPVEADRGEPAPAEAVGETVAGPEPDAAPSLVDLDALVVKLVTKRGRAATVALLGEFDATNTKTIAEGKRAEFAERAAKELAS